MSHSPSLKSLQSDLSQDNSDEYIPSDTVYTKRPNSKRANPSGERTSDSKTESDFKKSHHASCHRCGNIRRKYIYCDRCPQVFCMKCMDKMLEEHGNDCFKLGCPVCKKLCCCSEKSMSCPRKYHCYKKCLTTKKGIKKSLAYHANASPPVTPTVKKPDPILQSVPPKSVPLNLPVKPSAPTLSINSMSQFPNISLTSTPSLKLPIPFPDQPMTAPPAEPLKDLKREDSILLPTRSLLFQRSTNEFPPLSLHSTSSLRLPSTAGGDEPSMNPLLSRPSVPYMMNPPVWDPSMCQLHRAPDSVRPGGDPAVSHLMSLQRANSSQNMFLRRNSGSTIQHTPFSDPARENSHLWNAESLLYAERNHTLASPVPIRNQVSVDINSEVCFNANQNQAEPNGLVLLPPQFTATTVPAISVAPVSKATPLARSLSTEVVTEDAPVLATRVSTDTFPDVQLIKVDSEKKNK